MLAHTLWYIYVCTCMHDVYLHMWHIHEWSWNLVHTCKCTICMHAQALHTIIMHAAQMSVCNVYDCDALDAWICIHACLCMHVMQVHACMFLMHVIHVLNTCYACSFMHYLLYVHALMRYICMHATHVYLRMWCVYWCMWCMWCMFMHAIHACLCSDICPMIHVSMHMCDECVCMHEMHEVCNTCNL